MARVLPEQAIDTSSAAELRMRAVLVQLPAKWRVIHSVSWQSPIGRRQADGEADFVMVHPDHGVLVVEVKGGGIRTSNGEWFSVDRHGVEHKIKNPYDQAVRSKHALLRFLGERLEKVGFPVEHAVAFPDVHASPLGPAAPRDITWDRGLEVDPNAGVTATLNHYGMTASLTPRQVDDIVSLLLPSVDLKPPLFSAMQDAEQELARLTEAQIRTLDGLRRHRRALVYGSAGTGKTVLAVHKAAQLATHGFDVLLVCFNRPLADHVAAEVGDSDRVTVKSFHKLCTDESAKAGLPSQGDGSGWWDDALPNQLPEAALANGTSFDAIIVDEGQDFSPDWWLHLQLLLRDPDDGGFYVFADAEQSIYRDGWQPPFEGMEFDLTTNCRNTVPIASLVASLYGREVDTLGALGPDPSFTPISRMGETKDAVRKVLYRLMHEGKVPADEVAVLSPSKQVVDALRERKLGNLRLGERGHGDITAETVHRFKGLEASAVVLVLPPGDDIDTRLLYIGMSRARTHLEVVAEPGVIERLVGSAS